jgi:hypothetical protein
MLAIEVHGAVAAPANALAVWEEQRRVKVQGPLEQFRLKQSQILAIGTATWARIALWPPEEKYFQIKRGELASKYLRNNAHSEVRPKQQVLNNDGQL